MPPTSRPTDGGEQSVATAGSTVLYTTNDGDALSTDGGLTFNYLDPRTVFPSAAGGYCCDQVVAWMPRIKRFVWVIQYWAGSGGVPNDRLGNVVRVATATAGQVAASGGRLELLGLHARGLRYPALAPWGDVPAVRPGPRRDDAHLALPDGRCLAREGQGVRRQRDVAHPPDPAQIRLDRLPVSAHPGRVEQGPARPGRLDQGHDPVLRRRGVDQPPQRVQVVGRRQRSDLRVRHRPRHGRDRGRREQRPLERQLDGPLRQAGGGGGHRCQHGQLAAVRLDVRAEGEGDPRR